MGLDIRWPIGLMFTLIGVLLIGYGAVNSAAFDAARHQHQSHLGHRAARLRRADAAGRRARRQNAAERLDSANYSRRAGIPCIVRRNCIFDMTLPELAIELAQEFQQIYGRPPRWIVAAPGRVNVIGEHTDYNDGFVLPMAIERYAVMAADRTRRRQNRHLRSAMSQARAGDD